MTKRVFLILLAGCLLALLIATVMADGGRDSHMIYLPIVTSPREYIIDCVDGHGDFIECPER